ncbi:MAG: hypothetical protein HDR01_15570 [Lachnospiraceae bacterium]|nr:hypothetical protein [Lachnospiraceae bacterium]
MGNLQLGDFREFSGEYKMGFFGSAEHISVRISAERVTGRGYRELGNGKHEIAEFQYAFSQVTRVSGGQFDKKPCSIIVFNENDYIFFPGINVLTPTLESIFNQFKDLILEKETEEIKRLILGGTFTKAGRTQLQDEMQLFRETVTKLKDLKRQGFINPMEYSELRARLMDFYA